MICLLVKFCYFALHLHLKHFRSLEERKKQHKEGLYLSDTLPRKKTTPSISPHFSSATMGRSNTPKVGLRRAVALTFCESFPYILQRAKALQKKHLSCEPLHLLVWQPSSFNCLFIQRIFGVVSSGAKGIF